MPRHSLDTYSPRNSATWELALEARASPVAPRLRVDHAPVTPEFTVPAAACRPDPASRRGPAPASGPDQHPEAGGVEEPDLVQVDDELVAARADQVDEQLPQPRRGYISISPRMSMTSMPSLAW